MSQPNRSGGLFERYVIDAGHVSGVTWLVVALLLVAFPPAGLFFLGAVGISCVHRRPAADVADRKSGWRVMGQALAILAILLGGLMLLFIFWLIVAV